MTGDRFAGTGSLLRLILRLDRIKLTLWLAGLLFLIGITPTSVRAVIDAEAEASGASPEQVLVEQAILLQTNGASIALQGPPDALDTFGGRYAFEIGAITLAVVALMNILLIARHTRAEEESGRAELVRAAAVGPWSPLTAVGIVAVFTNLVLGLGVTLVFVSDGQSLGRSVLYGSSLALCGLLFAAFALIWVQVFEFGRAATGASLAGVGAAFALRAVGDVRDNWLSAVSPLGWVQAVNAFGEVAIWPFVVMPTAIVVAVGLAVVLAARRDVGAGFVSPGPGSPVASSSLATPLGFAWRLQRSTMVWWALGALFLGGVYGSVISSIDDFVEQNESMRDMLESLGVAPDALRDGFIALVLTMVALVATGGVIQTLLRPRGEEAAGRAEPMLGTALARRSWLGAHAVLTLLAAPAFMLAGGVGLVVADSLVTGEITDAGGVLVAALARVPALWAIAGLGLVLYGWAWRFAMGVWAVFAAGALIFLFGDLLRLPDVALNLSPFGHVGHLPGGEQGWLSIVVLCAIGFGGTIGSLVLLDRRDVVTA